MTAEVVPIDRETARRCQCRLCRDFRFFHATHPDVYREFVRIIDIAQRHRKTYGIGAVAEIYRWERTTIAGAKDDLKLNNNHRSRYARMILINEPRFRGFLKMRALHTPGCIADEIFEQVCGVPVEIPEICAECGHPADDITHDADSAARGALPAGTYHTFVVEDGE